MNIYLYAYRDNVGNFYGAPFNSGDDPDIVAVKFPRMCFAADDKQLDSLVNNELYLVGIFDDVKGEVTPCSQFIVNMGEIVKQVKQVRILKETEDGKEDRKEDTKDMSGCGNW